MPNKKQRELPLFSIWVATSVANVYRESFYSKTPIRGKWEGYEGPAQVVNLHTEEHRTQVILQQLEEPVYCNIRDIPK